EQLSHSWIPDELSACADDRDLSGDDNATDVREFETFFRVLLGDDDRYAFSLAKIAEHREYLLDTGRLEIDRRLVDQQQSRPHDKCARDLEQTTFACRESARRLVATRRERRITVEDPFSCVPRIPMSTHQIAAEPKVLLDCHVGEQ